MKVSFVCDKHGEFTPVDGECPMCEEENNKKPRRRRKFDISKMPKGRLIEIHRAVKLVSQNQITIEDLEKEINKRSK